MSQENEKSPQEQREKLADLVGSIKVCMMTTAADGGALRSRPMWTADADEPFDGDLLFFTYADSGKVHEFESDRHVGLSYADPSGECYVSVSGTASLTREAALIDRYWKESMTAWFPQGRRTPGLAMIRVAITHAEYWDSRSSTMLHLYGMAKAALTGRPVEGREAGDHAKVSV